MSTKILKRYQENAVNEIVKRSKKLLRESDKKEADDRLIIFKAPTGSGKTYIMSQYIEGLVNDAKKEDFCFLWISIGKGELHKQSYNSLKDEFNGFPPVYLLEQEFFGSRREIDKNEVVVVNWEKLRNKNRQTGEWKNVIMKDKETVNFRELIANTKETGRKIIMIIDESHSSATGERANELREIINADLVIEMSATPILLEGKHDKRLIKVNANDVIEEGMIKKEIIINENIDKFAKSESDSQKAILKAAWKKRLDLKEMLKKEDSDVNPLVLIQIPSGEEGREKKNIIEKIMAKMDISQDNSKLAIWLSEEKVNLEVLENNESEVEFLIFKQAIDTGWDCPRAHILVKLRDTKSKIMELQTVGRILRMPEALHYNNDRLNKAFIYTNIQPSEIDFKGKEEFIKNAIKSIFVKRDECYKPLKLRSYYRNRVDFSDLTMSFYGILEKVFCGYFEIEQNKLSFDFIKKNTNKLKKKNVEIVNLDQREEIILNKVLDASLFDNLGDEKIEIDDIFMANLSEEDKERAFDNLIKNNLNGFAPARSMSIFQGALFGWFKKYLGIKKRDNGLIYVQNIVLNNFEAFGKLFDKTVRAYIPTKEKEVNNRIKDLEEWNKEWEVAENRNYNQDTHKPADCKLSLYKKPSDKKAYLQLDSQVEEEFIKLIDSKKDKIKWWWQNGNEHMALNFGIKYDKGGGYGEKASTFQPDFLVMFKNGKLGIYDTKGAGFQEDDNKLKAEVLQKYIKEENKRRKKKFLTGGIIVKEKKHFLINSDDVYVPFGGSVHIAKDGVKKKDEKGWRYLDF